MPQTFGNVGRAFVFAAVLILGGRILSNQLMDDSLEFGIQTTFACVFGKGLNGLRLLILSPTRRRLLLRGLRYFQFL